MPNDRRQPSPTLRLLTRLGLRPIPLDRTGGLSPFAVGGWYSDCPRCSAFAGVLVDSDGYHWRSACGCFGYRRLDALDLILSARVA